MITMDLINVRVKHEKFGEGTIISIDGAYMTISYSIGEKIFVYPDAFEKHISAVSTVVHTSIMQVIEAARQEENQKAEKLAHIHQHQNKLVEKISITDDLKTSESRREPIVQSKRIDSKPMMFYVFQGKTFDRESRGGYIWAPMINKDGMTFHHWNRLLDIRSGDIILHGCDGKVAALSIARDKCYECDQPEELKEEELWDKEGRRVDCDYQLISNPINTSDFTDDIKRLCKAKYAPFNKDGNGNMGYLFDINQELAKIFITASVKRNKYLADVDIINRFLI